MTSADFASAQRRVAARRHEREAAIQARATQQQELCRSRIFDQLPAPLNLAWLRLRSEWNLISGREGTAPAFRVGQVDAELLDEELLGLLKGQVGEALKYYGPHLQDDWATEIVLVLRAVLFKLSIWDHDASYGAALQNLRYADARSETLAHSPPKMLQKTLHGLFSVGGSYVWTKWGDYLLDVEGSDEEPPRYLRALSHISSMLSTTYNIAAFTSFLVFLFNGRYRTIIDRILRLRLTPTTNHVSREVSFEYLNRQLVWHAFTEFLLFVLPLIGVSRWRRWLGRAWRKTKSMLRRDGRNDDEDARTGGELGFLPERTCAICYQDQNPSSAAENEIAAISAASSGIVGSAQTDITNPYETIPCGCIYCFVCLARRLEAEDGEGWTCLRCGEMVKECKPWSGDVVEQTPKSNPTKSVTFAGEEKEDGELAALDPTPVNDDDG